MLEFLLWVGVGSGRVGWGSGRVGWGWGWGKGGEGLFDVGRTEDVVAQPPCREGHEFAVTLTTVCLGAG